MRCTEARSMLSALLDGELPPERAAKVRAHFTGCAECTVEYEKLVGVSSSLKEHLVRYPAPAQLENRIRQAIADDEAFAATSPTAVRFGGLTWQGSIAAGLLIAVASSALTYAVTRRQSGADVVVNQIVASHVRALMPGHLTDVASNNLHNVKPWFAGRVDVSPPVPALDSAGFPLAGGRVDYIEGRSVATLVYMRRQHIIDVYAWPSPSGDAAPKRMDDVNGYHIIRWGNAGIELWAISDVDPHELERFVASFR
jgi:anti-sigma factor RsiW